MLGLGNVTSHCIIACHIGEELGGKGELVGGAGNMDKKKKGERDSAY